MLKKMNMALAWGNIVVALAAASLGHDYQSAAFFAAIACWFHLQSKE